MYKRQVEILALFILASVIFSVIRDKKDNGYWTIAVFGVDSRDGKLGKGALSDVEMICNINKATGEIQLVSVFRDCLLYTSGIIHPASGQYMEFTAPLPEYFQELLEKLK